MTPIRKVWVTFAVRLERSHVPCSRIVHSEYQTPTRLDNIVKVRGHHCVLVSIAIELWAKLETMDTCLSRSYTAFRYERVLQTPSST